MPAETSSSATSTARDASDAAMDGGNSADQRDQWQQQWSSQVRWLYQSSSAVHISTPGEVMCGALAVGRQTMAGGQARGGDQDRRVGVGTTEGVRGPVSPSINRRESRTSGVGFLTKSQMYSVGTSRNRRCSEPRRRRPQMNMRRPWMTGTRNAAMRPALVGAEDTPRTGKDHVPEFSGSTP